MGQDAAAAEVDHVFLCTEPGAPAAELLREFGLEEGTPNRHPGQGTACRRFFFRNAMIELLWVADAAEVRCEASTRMRLAARCAMPPGPDAPIGIVLRPAARGAKAAPFPAWEYRPASMPGVHLQIADAAEGEPLWIFAPAGQRQDAHPAVLRQPMRHPAGFGELTRLRFCSPALDPCGVTAAMCRLGVIEWRAHPAQLVELEFDSARLGRRADFSPRLPLSLLW